MIYSVSKTIPSVIQNGSNYDDHFIIKELAKAFKKQFTSLGEITEKYITFAVPIEKYLKSWRRNYKQYILHITSY